MASSTSKTELSLIDRVRRRDAGAWEQLVELYAPLIASWCLRKGVPQRNVADCVQDVFLAVFKGIRRFESQHKVEGSFRAWLWVVTRSRLANWFQRNQQEVVGGSSHQQRLDSVATGSISEADISNSGSHAIENRPFSENLDSDEPTQNLDLQSLMRRAMNQVQPQVQLQTWNAFYRCVVDGLSTDIVAKELELSPASVRQARSRVLRRIRQQMGDLE